MQHDEVGGQHPSTGAAPACRMAAAHDWHSRSLLQVIWQVIMHGHCSFRAKTKTQNFCRNEYNVTGAQAVARGGGGSDMVWQHCCCPSLIGSRRLPAPGAQCYPAPGASAAQPLCCCAASAPLCRPVQPQQLPTGQQPLRDDQRGGRPLLPVPQNHRAGTHTQEHVAEDPAEEAVRAGTARRQATGHGRRGRC
jgi:hypothetical protein